MTQATLSTMPINNIPAYNSGLQPSLMDSNNLIWVVAITLSLTLHAVLIFYKNNKLNAVPAMVSQETITHVRFSSIVPPPINVIEPEIKPEIIKPEPEPERIQPKVEEKIVEIKKPDPIVKPKSKKKKPKPKKPTPKPVKKKVTTPKPPVKEQKSVVKPQPRSLNENPKITKEIKTSPIVSNADKRLIEQTRKSYFALLMRHVEVHKHYPRVARKRKIEGEILISFSLFADGSIKNLLINGKRSILEKASKNAIANALPMPMP
ncbi:MAG: energy transducer TonB, partial [Gammaproteobacteria bacterium]|nr:energy transducer TonB [Gammaproteobacteria bacterium]